MKKYLSLLLLGLAVILSSGCYKKARQAEEDDGSGVSNYSKWDWSGEAPLSGIINGSSITLNSSTTINKVIMNSPLRIFTAVITVPNEEQLGEMKSYNINVGSDVRTGVYTSVFGVDVSKFNFSYMHQSLANIGNPSIYSTKKLVVKIIKNDDKEVEGYFYGTLVSGYNSQDIIEMKEGYFKIDKSDAITIN